ncbi:MAG: outer membrane protein transport protein [Candidatus Hydrogenedens sp.]|nr:outer membrane protein transport protein [Candidatus Hydrogenedens sp.]
MLNNSKINNNTGKTILQILIISITIYSSYLYANEGVFVLGNDAYQLGRASSGIASPRSAYWCYMNPASMVELNKRLDLNWYIVKTDIEMHPRGLIGNRFESPLEGDGLFNIASGGMIIPLDVGTLGVGLYVPSGTGVDYQNSRNILSRLWNADRKLFYQHMRLVVAYGYKFDNGWAIGGGIHGSVSRFKSDHITLSLLPTEGDFDWDESYGAGFNLSIYKKWEKFAIGATYTSRHWTERFQHYKDLLRYPLDQPQILNAGVAYDVNDKLTLSLDFKWLNWEGIPAYGRDLTDGGFNWVNQFCTKLGVEYRINDKTRILAGYSHGNSPITEDHVFLAGLVPVLCEDHFTLGLARKITEHDEVSLSGVVGLKNKMTDTGNGDLLSHLGQGTELSTGGFSIVLGYTHHF